MSFVELVSGFVVLLTGGRQMQTVRAFIGMGVHKATISMIVAEDGHLTG